MQGTHTRGRRSVFVHLGHIGAGAMLAFIALGFLVPAIEETHRALTTVVPTRICGNGQTGSCVTRKSALVVAANGSRFTPARLKHGVTVSLEGPKRQTRLDHGTTRMNAFVDPLRLNRPASVGPRGQAAWSTRGGGTIGWAIGWFLSRGKQRKGGPRSTSGISEQHART